MNVSPSSVAERIPASELDQLQAELLEERRARELAIQEAELQRRHVRALEQLMLATRGGGDVDELATRLLRVLTEALRAKVALLRWRDGDQLVARASLGAEPSELSGTLALSHAFGAAGASAAPQLVSGEELSLRVDALGVVVVVGLPLTQAGALCGGIWLGLPVVCELSADDRTLLEALGAQIASAIAEHVERDDLQRAVRSRDEILGIVAHDLRNPLNVISAAANSLHHRMSDSVSRRPLERIMRAAQRAEHLIRDLLDLSAIESGQFSIEKRPVDTASLVLTALDSQQGLAAASCVILASDLSPALPWVHADEERVLEVLENLIGNAVKFTMAGGTVTVGASVESSRLLLWVKDNGHGIATDQLTHLFDRFWQASKADRRGTGLGLTICKAIVEAHGGRIWAESEPGAGTTVFFTLPAYERTPQSEGTPVANILLVDDRPENLLSLRAILEQPDYRLVCASSGEEALRLSLRENFAVVLLDVSMPGMDGLEVAIHLKELERSRDVPIIFITAFGDDPEEIHRAYSAGGADYLVKPLDAEIVRKKVAVFVDLGRRKRDSERLKHAEAKS